MLLEDNFGFAKEIFNVCCRIGDISFWHGIHRGYGILRKVNPLNAIKRTVTTHYFNRDTEIPRGKNFLFTNLYLSCEITEKRYILVNPFQRGGQFSNSSTRASFIKALLNTNSYLQECKRCSLKFYNLLLHQLTTCPNLIEQRTTLRNKIIFYGTVSNPNLENLQLLMELSLNNTNLFNALTEFLETSEY